MIEISNCPVCKHSEFVDFIKCQDFTVTNESFQLVRCAACGFTFTNPQPHPDTLGNYYLSENYISHSGKARTTIDQLYLFLRKRSLRWKQSLLSKGKGRLLDYGCGTGEFLKTCQQAGWTVSGVEPSSIARTKASTSTGIKIKSSFDGLERFDAITLWHVLEHVSDLNNILTQLGNSLNSEGQLFIAVPNLESYDANYYQQFWAGYDVPRHLWHFTRNSMEAILKNNGLTIVKIIPMKLDSFYVSMLSEQYKNSSPRIFQLLKAFFIGLLSNWKAKNVKAYSSLIYVAEKK